MNAIAQTDQNKEYPCWYLSRYTDGHPKGEIVAHQKYCVKCCQWLSENDSPRFEYVLNRALSTRKRRNYPIIAFAATKGYKIDVEVSTDSQILRDIIDFSVSYAFPKDLGKLPGCSGVYVLVINNQNSTKAGYIGSSKNVRSRLTDHHHINPKIQILIQAGAELSIHCLLFPDPSTEEAMRQTEKFLIRELNPTLNNVWV